MRDFRFALARLEYAALLTLRFRVDDCCVLEMTIASHSDFSVLSAPAILHRLKQRGHSNFLLGSYIQKHTQNNIRIHSNKTSKTNTPLEPGMFYPQKYGSQQHHERKDTTEPVKKL